MKIDTYNLIQGEYEDWDKGKYTDTGDGNKKGYANGIQNDKQKNNDCLRTEYDFYSRRKVTTND